MRNTLTSVIEGRNQTTGYNAKNEKRDFFNWNSVIAPAGLIKSNTKDMLKFVIELLNYENKPINTKLESTYFKNTFIEYGLGINILTENGKVVFFKTGDTLGQSSVLAYNPEERWDWLFSQIKPMILQGNFLARYLKY